MVWRLKDEQIEWLGERFPNLFYDRMNNNILGTVEFSCQYKELESVSDKYEIRINLNLGNFLPAVYETGGKIKHIAKVKGKQLEDLHQYSDGRLCLIRSDEFFKWYPCGFDLRRLMENVITHLYWVSYFSLYGKEPWPSQPHGGNYLKL